MEPAAILGFAAASFAIALAPGPSWIYIISSTVGQGPRGGAVAIAGNATGIAGHVVAAALGLSAVLAYSATLYTALKWAGALYLMFLAVQMLRGRSRFQPGAEDEPAKTTRAIFRGGALVNLLNPKVSLLMLAILPQFVDSTRADVSWQIVVFGVIHVAVASLVLSVVSLFAGRATDLLSRSESAERTFRWATGSVLFVLGAKMALVED